MTDVTEVELMAKAQYPRVTYDQLCAEIVTQEFIQRDLTTICVLTLKNGFTAIGVSACAVPGNFDLDLGQRLARKDAEGKLWPVLGYELKSKVALVTDTTFPDEINVVDPHFLNPLVTYVGTKVIKAVPLTLGHYNHHRNWTLPFGEDPDSLGYLVQYPDGYISWSPKEIFENAYQQIDISMD